MIFLRSRTALSLAVLTSSTMLATAALAQDTGATSTVLPAPGAKASDPAAFQQKTVTQGATDANTGDPDAEPAPPGEPEADPVRIDPDARPVPAPSISTAPAARSLVAAATPTPSAPVVAPEGHGDDSDEHEVAPHYSSSPDESAPASSPAIALASRTEPNRRSVMQPSQTEPRNDAIVREDAPEEPAGDYTRDAQPRSGDGAAANAPPRAYSNRTYPNRTYPNRAYADRGYAYSGYRTPLPAYPQYAYGRYAAPSYGYTGYGYAENRYAPQPAAWRAGDYREGGGFDDAVGNCSEALARDGQAIAQVEGIRHLEGRFSVEGTLRNGATYACGVSDDGRIWSLAVNGRAMF